MAVSLQSRTFRKIDINGKVNGQRTASLRGPSAYNGAITARNSSAVHNAAPMMAAEGGDSPMESKSCVVTVSYHRRTDEYVGRYVIWDPTFSDHLQHAGAHLLSPLDGKLDRNDVNRLWKRMQTELETGDHAKVSVATPAQREEDLGI